MAIQFENVTLLYEPGQLWEKRALHDIDLKVDKGEIIGIIGPTGSGKSTLLQLMNGILLPTRGRVLIDGKDTRQLKGRQLTRLRHKVGLVFQFPEDQLFESRVYDDIAFGPRNLGLHNEEVLNRVRWAMESLQLDFAELSQCSPFALSGGQKRRAAIAGVLAMKPDYFVLDEPAAGLDAVGRKQLQQLLQDLRRDEGIAVVLVSHQLRDIFEICDRVVVLKDGLKAADDLSAWVLGQHKLLDECGLRLPPVNRLLHGLKASFPHINTEIVEVAAAADEVAGILGENR